jgi:hypothetical protein
VTREASVQFIEPLLFRVIRVHDWPTYDGWVWLDGYQLNSAGDAVERRSIFVQVNGLQPGTLGNWVRADGPRTRPAANVGRALTHSQVRQRVG